MNLKRLGKALLQTLIILIISAGIVGLIALLCVIPFGGALMGTILIIAIITAVLYAIEDDK